jgi:hypothetical protein
VVVVIIVIDWFLGGFRKDGVHGDLFFLASWTFMLAGRVLGGLALALLLVVTVELYAIFNSAVMVVVLGECAGGGSFGGPELGVSYIVVIVGLET